jgi:general stress protein 26
MKERMWREHPILHEYFSSCDCPDYRLIKITVAQAMLMDNPQTGYQKLPV